jgi:hypothetical protein
LKLVTKSNKELITKSIKTICDEAHDSVDNGDVDILESPFSLSYLLMWFDVDGGPTKVIYDIYILILFFNLYKNL